VEGQCVWHAEVLERGAGREDPRLLERAAEGADLGERIGVEVREDARRGDARGVALEVEGFQVVVRFEEGAEGPAEGGVELDVPVEHDVAD